MGESLQLKHAASRRSLNSKLTQNLLIREFTRLKLMWAFFIY